MLWSPINTRLAFYIIFLFLLDKTNNVENRIKMPPGVSYEISVAQFCSIIVTVVIMITGGDAMSAITQLVEGYEPEIMLTSRNATFARWCVVKREREVDYWEVCRQRRVSNSLYRSISLPKQGSSRQCCS